MNAPTTVLETPVTVKPAAYDAYAAYLVAHDPWNGEPLDYAAFVDSGEADLWTCAPVWQGRSVYVGGLFADISELTDAQCVAFGIIPAPRQWERRDDGELRGNWDGPAW
jgi:hypothetical protein